MNMKEFETPTEESGFTDGIDEKLNNEKMGFEQYRKNILDGIKAIFNLPIREGSGVYAIVEGNIFSNTASNFYSHAEGDYTKASGAYAHAEGAGNSANGEYLKAIGNQSHAEGFLTKSIGDSSHAEGEYVAAGSLAFKIIGPLSGQQTTGQTKYEILKDDYYLLIQNTDENKAILNIDFKDGLNCSYYINHQYAHVPLRLFPA